MRALTILWNKFEKGIAEVHSARCRAVFLAVQALLIGEQAWLTALGRARPGSTDKHGIKAIDRLLGNRQLWMEMRIFFAALAWSFLKSVSRPVILIDETEIRPGIYAVTASLASDGRGIPLYEIVQSKKVATSRWCRRKFLNGLAKVLPPHVTPILVTDAGFESTWFDEIEARCWDFVGRVRHKTTFFDGKKWVSPQQLHRRATNRPRNLGCLPFPRRRPKARRVVISKARVSKGRKRHTTQGKRSLESTNQRHEKSAREPWLLATSLTAKPCTIVAIYATRMQIEQNYRDAKNSRWGWSLSQTRTRIYKRLEVLLLIVAIAYAVQLTVGCSGEQQRLHRQFQANTVHDRRVLSVFVLGGLLLRSHNQHVLATCDIRAGFLELVQRIQRLE